jgi:hypothetical protein
MTTIAALETEARAKFAAEPMAWSKAVTGEINGKTVMVRIIRPDGCTGKAWNSYRRQVLINGKLTPKAKIEGALA